MIRFPSLLIAFKLWGHLFKCSKLSHNFDNRVLLQDNRSLLKGRCREKLPLLLLNAWLIMLSKGCLIRIGWASSRWSLINQTELILLFHVCPTLSSMYSSYTFKCRFIVPFSFLNVIALSVLLPWPYNKALLARVFSEHPLFVGPIKVELHSIIILWRWWFRAFWGQTLLLNIVELLFEEVHQGVVKVNCRVIRNKLVLL